MPRMRTLDEAFRMLKSEDEGTAISKNALRTMILTGRVPSVLIGQRKRLIDYDKMLEAINNPPVQSDTQADYGTIRRVGA